MTIQESTIEKIKQLPDPLAREVSDFIDFLLTRYKQDRRHPWDISEESLTLSESDISDYLRNLEDYENRLSGGEIQCMPSQSTVLEA